MNWIRLWITCAGIATHSCLHAWNNSRTFARVFTLRQTCFFSWFQVCLLGFKSGDMTGQGRIWTLFVGRDLCGVVCCMGSGIIMWQARKVAFLCFWTLYVWETLHSVVRGRWGEKNQPLYYVCVFRCDGEFVEGLKSYIDSGLDRDATRLRAGRTDMPDLQLLLQMAGRGLQRFAFWCSLHTALI